jgi:uncharacterized membrane protein
MTEPTPGLTETLAENIDRLTARRRREAADAPWSDRLAARITTFAGSMAFVGLHLALFGGWIAWNLWGSPKFDPSFVTLAMIASVEAIFLSTFVLISQNRQAADADRRADLDLHISLLTEHELSKMADLLTRTAERLGVDGLDRDDIAEIRVNVQPERVLDALAQQDTKG